MHSTPSSKPSLLPLAGLSVALFAFGCGSAPEAETPRAAPTPTTTAAAAPDQPTEPAEPENVGEVPPPLSRAQLTGADLATLERVESAATALGGTLRTRLLGAMGEGGPVHAVGVCADDAPEIARTVTRETGVQVGRASLRERGAQEPPPWVREWLAEQGERPGAGVEGFAYVYRGEARVLRPIVVEGACLNCHGERVTPEVEAAITARYPDDRARGYHEGELRGALWAFAPLDEG